VRRTTLATLLSPVTVPEFLDQYFGEAFLYLPGSPEKFSTLNLALLAQEVERALEAPVRIGDPVSARREQDGIFLQLDGSSDCKIHGDAETPEGDPLWAGLLNSGDALYVPRGWWLSAQPHGQHAILDIQNPTGADLLEWLFESAKKDKVFKADIPRFADAAAKADYVTALRQRMGRFFRAPALLEAFRRENNFAAPPQTGAGIPWSADTPDNHKIVLLSARKFRIKRGVDDTILLVAMGKRLTFPPDAAPLLHYLSDRAPVGVRDFFQTFEAEFDRDELSDFLSVLSAEGMIAVCR
jgi:hypothetical protein